MTTWFTSDHHFGHANIIKHCNRPFVNVGDMEGAMIQKWNERVQPTDTVWHLGDLFSFKPREMDADHARFILDKLNGTLHLVLGNHDVQPWLNDVMQAGFYHCDIVDYREMKDALTRKTIVLCHYPIESWNGMHHDAVHLHGHSHGMLTHKIANRVDVGVDVWRFYPVRLENIFNDCNA